jgi:PAS domain S-box-containing protein
MRSKPPNILIDREHPDMVRRVLDAIMDSSEDAIVVASLDGTIAHLNPAAERLFGFAAGDVAGKSQSILIPQARLQEYKEVLSRVRRGEIVHQYQTEYLRSDGAPLSISLTVVPIHDQNSNLIAIVSIARDLDRPNRKTESSEPSLSETEGRFRALVESSPDGIIVHRLGKFLYANSVALRMYHADSLEQLQSRTVLDLIHPDDREAILVDRKSVV